MYFILKFYCVNTVGAFVVVKSSSTPEYIYTAGWVKLLHSQCPLAFFPSSKKPLEIVLPMVRVTLIKTCRVCEGHAEHEDEKNDLRKF